VPRPYFARIAFVQMVYLSSESRRRPSMSKRHARTGGKLRHLLTDCWMLKWPHLLCPAQGHLCDLQPCRR
jgi:hypothetical protein